MTSILIEPVEPFFVVSSCAKELILPFFSRQRRTLDLDGLCHLHRVITPRILDDGRHTMEEGSGTFRDAGRGGEKIAGTANAKASEKVHLRIWDPEQTIDGEM